MGPQSVYVILEQIWTHNSCPSGRWSNNIYSCVMCWLQLRILKYTFFFLQKFGKSCSIDAKRYLEPSGIRVFFYLLSVLKIPTFLSTSKVCTTHCTIWSTSKAYTPTFRSIFKACPLFSGPFLKTLSLTGPLTRL